jgi:small subunit ribosomal protein S20
LANIKSAVKNVRKSARRRERNLLFRSRARTFVKKTRRQIEAGDLEGAQATARLTIQALDKAAQKGIIHPNNAARRKSRLMKQLNQAVKAQTTE